MKWQLVPIVSVIIAIATSLNAGLAARSEEQANVRCAHYREVINAATGNHYEQLKTVEPEVALILWSIQLWRLGGYFEAAEFLQRILQAQIETFGIDDLTVASTMRTLGDLYFEWGHESNGERLYLQSILIQRRILGYNNAYTTASMERLALNLTKSARLRRTGSFYLFQTYQLQLKTLYPSLSHLNAVAACERDSQKLLPQSQGNWIDRFAHNAKNEQKAMVSLYKLLDTPPSVVNVKANSENMRQCLLEYADLLRVSLSTEARTPFQFPPYLNPTTGRLEYPEVEETASRLALKKKKQPGVIECRQVYRPKEGPTKIDLKIADMQSGTEFRHSITKKELVEGLAIRKDMQEFIYMITYGGINLLPFQLALQEKPEFLRKHSHTISEIYRRIKNAWKPAGFSQWQPVELEVQIDKHGKLVKTKLIHSEGNKVYDDAAIGSIVQKYPDHSKDFDSVLTFRCKFGELATNLSVYSDGNQDPISEKMYSKKSARLGQLQREIVEHIFGPNK